MKSRRKVVLGATSLLSLLLFTTVVPDFGTSGTAFAQSLGAQTGRPLPRFESLRFNEVRMRKGPGVAYPIRYLYLRQGLPVQVFREYQDWREVRDNEGATGWIKRTQLSRKRTGLVIADLTVVRRYADPESRAVVKVPQNYVVDLETCQPDWCEVRVAGYRGWIARGDLWGVLEDEVLEER